MMTNEEIIRDYKQAAAPMKQIKILAELNQKSTKEIAQILKEAGCDLPGQYDKKPKVEKAVAEPELAVENPFDSEIVRELVRQKIELENENKKLKALIIKMIERELA